MSTSESLEPVNMSSSMAEGTGIKDLEVTQVGPVQSPGTLCVKEGVRGDRDKEDVVTDPDQRDRIEGLQMEDGARSQGIRAASRS